MQASTTRTMLVHATGSAKKAPLLLAGPRDSHAARAAGWLSRSRAHSQFGTVELVLWWSSACGYSRERRERGGAKRARLVV